MAAAAAAEAVEAAVEATVVAMGVAVREPEAVYIRIKSIVKASISLSSTRKGYGSGVWIKGMDQGYGSKVWIMQYHRVWIKVWIGGYGSCVALAG